MAEESKLSGQLTPQERVREAISARIHCAQELMGILATKGLDLNPRQLNGTFAQSVLAMIAALNEEERACRELRLEAELEAVGLGGILVKLPPEYRP